jgi:DNA-binding response OmpR family regulator
VILAEDGLSGVEKATSEKPDLVITDGLLPKLHGFLACKAIKALHPAPKVILLTGIYTKMTYKWEVKAQYGADDLLTKPTRPADLLACVEKHLAHLPQLDRLE